MSILKRCYCLIVPAPEDEALLARALEMSMEPGEAKSSANKAAPVEPNLAAMTEEEQIEYAMRMSMQVKFYFIFFESADISIH